MKSGGQIDWQMSSQSPVVWWNGEVNCEVVVMCVGYFYFHMLQGFCFAGFLPFLSRGYILHVSICVFLR
jgi:hypothetical protein